MPQRDQSPTTAVETWGLSPQSRVWIGGNNVSARREIELIAGECIRPSVGELDRAFIVPSTADEAVYFARKIRPRIVPGGSVWVITPKFGSAAERDFSGSMDEMIVSLFELGYVESAKSGVSENYSSTGFILEAEP